MLRVMKICEDCGTQLSPSAELEEHNQEEPTCDECGYDGFLEYIPLTDHQTLLTKAEQMKKALFQADRIITLNGKRHNLSQPGRNNRRRLLRVEL
jgi:hypothetical protein